MSEYPSDWEITNLGDLATIKASNVDKKTKEGQRNVLLCNYMDVFKNPVVSSSLEFMKSTASEKEISEFSLSRGDVLLTKDSEVPEEIGIPSVVTDDISNLVCGYHLYMIRADHSRINPEYLCWTLRSNYSRQYFYQMANGSTRFGLNLKHVEECPVAVPPLPEQKKIAEILSGIDHLIATTNRRMLSELSLRAGLLKEMISEDGAFLKLDSVSTRVSGHTPSKSNPEYWNGGIPWISLSDTAKLDKRYIGDTAKEISGQGIQNSSAVLHPAGLVVLSRDARVGCSAITTKKMAVSQHFIGWICSEQLLNRYLYYVLQKWKNKFEAIAMGSTIPTIGVPFFRDLEIPVPPMSEQRKIADTIESVDCHIEELRQRIDYLQNLKSAVASDLLSGRKRVSV